MDDSQQSIEQQNVVAPKMPSYVHLPLVIVGIVMFLVGLGVGFLLSVNKSEKIQDKMTTATPTVTHSLDMALSPTPNSTGLLEVSCSERYICNVSLQNEKTKKSMKRVIDISQLGWDVALIGQYAYGKNLMFYNPDSDQLIIPLTSAPGGDGGSKPEGTLPDPPFLTAIYSTKFTTSSQLTKLYASTDFEAKNSLFLPSIHQLFLTEETGSSDSYTLSKEIIWSYNLDTQSLQKFTEVVFPELSQSGSIFKELQLSGNEIIQRVEPNGGNISSKAKIITIDINTKAIKMEDAPWH